MESFEIKDLLTVKGKPGLWKLVKYVPAAKMARVHNLLDETMFATINLKDIVALKNYRIFLNGEGETTLESIFETMMTLIEKGELKNEELDAYDSMSEADKAKIMEQIIPNHDASQFKSYHLTKIIKWYKDVDKALDLLNAGIEDHYDNEEDEEEDDKHCECIIMCAGGDQAPRIWECEKHGKTGMTGTMSIIGMISVKLAITPDEAWDNAKVLLERKRKEYIENKKIYFCEDYFCNDLIKEFDLKLEK